jgi:hypothetical protein
MHVGMPDDGSALRIERRLNNFSMNPRRPSIEPTIILGFHIMQNSMHTYLIIYLSLLVRLAALSFCAISIIVLNALSLRYSSDDPVNCQPMLLAPNISRKMRTKI